MINEREIESGRLDLLEKDSLDVLKRAVDINDKSEELLMQAERVRDTLERLELQLVWIDPAE